MEFALNKISLWKHAKGQLLFDLDRFSCTLTPWEKETTYSRRTGFFRTVNISVAGEFRLSR